MKTFFLKNKIKRIISLLLISFVLLSNTSISFAIEFSQDFIQNEDRFSRIDDQMLGKTFCEEYGWLSNPFKRAGCGIVYSFLKILLEIVAKFAELTAGTFDWAVDRYILNIKNIFKDNCVNIGDACTDKDWIYNSWSVMRDVANILMFFSAMYVGIRYILGNEELDFKKSLIKIIVFAVFVNFSFALSRFAIDISNFVSLSFRGGITEYAAGRGVSGVIMQYTGVSTAVNSVGNIDSTFKGFRSWPAMALAIVFLGSAFFVFLYATIMVLLRAIVLLACVIFSPIMFITTSFKSMEKINQVWRDNFIGQLLFGPVFMLMLWLTVGFLKNANIVSASLRDGVFVQTAYAAGASAPEVNQTGLTALAIVSLFLSVFASNKVSSGLGGAIGSKLGSMAKSAGLGVVTGGAGFALRNTVGRVGNWMSNSKWVKEKKENGGAIARTAAGVMSFAGDKMANAKVTIGDKSSVSATEKLSEDKAKLSKGSATALREFGLRDELAQAKTPEQLKVLEAKLKDRKEVSATGGDKSKWKTDEQIKRAIGIDTDEMKKQRYDNKSDLAENRVSGSKANDYVDAKAQDIKLNTQADKASQDKLDIKKDLRDERMQRASTLRVKRENKLGEVESLDERIKAEEHLRDKNTNAIGKEVSQRIIDEYKSKREAMSKVLRGGDIEEAKSLIEKNKNRAEAGAQAVKQEQIVKSNISTADQYKDTDVVKVKMDKFKQGVKSVTANIWRDKKKKNKADTVQNAAANTAL